MDKDQNNPLCTQTQTETHIIHFNSAGCSLPSTQTLDSVTSYLHEEASIGGYETQDKYSTDLNHTIYQSFATLLNCDPTEVAIVSSATEAWQQILYGLAWQWQPGNIILTCQHEYGSNYIAYLQLAKRTGINIVVIPETPQGDICLQSLKTILQSKQHDQSSRVVLISISHIPTSSGRVYDAVGVGALAQKYNVPYLLDACQSVGQMPIDVQKIGCMWLTGTGRKYLRGPRGTGFLYCSQKAFMLHHSDDGDSNNDNGNINSNITTTANATNTNYYSTFEPATLDNVGATWTSRNHYTMQPTAKRFERYEMSFAARYGLCKAVQQCIDMGIDTIWKRIQHLSQYMRTQLSAILEVRITDHGVVLCGIVSFIVQGHDPDVVRDYLMKEKKINTSVSRIASTRIDFEERGLDAVIRASVHFYNNEWEVDQLVNALIEYLNEKKNTVDG